MNRPSNAVDSVVLIAPLGEPDRRVRLAKTIRIIARDFNRSVSFWGWRRLPEEKLGAGLDGIVETRAVMSGGGYRSRFLKIYYLFYMSRVFCELLVRAPRNVYALGLETALPTWAASRFRRRIRYVFDDADRFVLFVSFPKPIERLVVFFERQASRAAVCHIVPTFERYDYRTERQYEIANLPDQRQVAEARCTASERQIKPKDDGRDTMLNVYVNGWLDATRGLDLLDGAAQILEEDEIEAIRFNVAASRPTSEMSPFFKRSKVHHLGTLTHIESLMQYPANDVVVTFYDPKVRINRYALPNKWGDAIAMGTPVICNAEVVTAAPLLSAGAAFAVPFHGPAALAQLLKDLAVQPERLSAARAAIAEIERSAVYFDEAISLVLGDLVRKTDSAVPSTEVIENKT